LAVRLKAGRST